MSELGYIVVGWGIVNYSILVFLIVWAILKDLKNSK